ncbi:nuclear intron maturase 1 -related [Anaeramoeba flamelloides]|uniref:Nuclear intron maturase 1 -related n=1 Tax=Anaeramoeba flamelloides TaxID=1746091 RepID=A0AAV7ZD37_9EUKA|nr:nuclear intron maturase 1 -related [Anaeramoeba flamelloides]
MVINKIKIEKDLEIKQIYSCREESKFQEEFILYFKDKELNEKNFSNFKKKFTQTIHIIQDLKYEDYITIQKMIEFIADPYTKKTITREKKNWNKILKKINSEFRLNNINWWKHYNRIRGNSLKMIKNNPKMEYEYQAHIDSIKKEIIKKFLKEIQETKNFFSNEESSNTYFEKKEIEEQIKWIKNKSVKQFDKIYLYKKDSRKIEDKKYQENYSTFIDTLQRIFQNWIKNPERNNLKYIKERDLLFLHKKGDEGITLNYRPISINNALARIFLKLVYKRTERSWEHITPAQFGFRKQFDTRIAVKIFLKKFKEEKGKRKSGHTWAVTIDLAKCFDSVPHRLIVETAPKFIKDPLIREFIKQYYAGDGTGVYQGDPLSPIIFAYISHFILQKMQPHAIHTQMYADDLILIMEGISENKIDEQLKSSIYPIIEKYGLTVNDTKTEKVTALKKIKYLGIWLNKKEHIKKNLPKAKDNYQKNIYIYANGTLSNALKIQLFKAVILPQVLYGLDIFNLIQTDYNEIDTWVNKRLKKIIKIQRGTPTDILKWETRTEPTSHMILSRKANFIKKLKLLELDHLAEDLQLDVIEGIDWENMGKKEIKKKIHQTHIKSIQDKVDSSKEEENWKLKRYLKISQFPENFSEKQPDLNWRSSTTLFKLKSFCNGLNRYTYKWEKGVDSKICPCCKKKVDDVGHFIWECKKYERARRDWKKQIKENKIFDYNIIIKKDTDTLLRIMNQKEIYDPTIDYFLTNMTQHAIKKKELKANKT